MITYSPSGYSLLHFKMDITHKWLKLFKYNLNAIQFNTTVMHLYDVYVTFATCKGAFNKRVTCCHILNNTMVKLVLQ